MNEREDMAADEPQRDGEPRNADEQADSASAHHAQVDDAADSEAQPEQAVRNDSSGDENGAGVSPPAGASASVADRHANAAWWQRLLLIMGIDTTAPRRLSLTLQPRFFMIGAGFVLVFVLLGVGMFFYSTHPSFCNTCHIMDPYYTAWQNSSHNMVSCVDCHYPPTGSGDLLWRKFQASSQVVKYVTRTYSSKPFAEVEDAACLRSGCHDLEDLGGEIVTDFGVKFHHQPHLTETRKGRELRCVSCHSQIMVGQHMEVTYDTCYLCHLKDKKEGPVLSPLGGCLGCHTVPTEIYEVNGTVVNHQELSKEGDAHCQSCHQDAIHGDGEVTEDRCYMCHNRPEQIAKFNEVQFLHDNHVTDHNLACLHCHKKIKHGVTEVGTKTLEYECSSCHSDAHDVARQLYRGEGLKGIPEGMPNEMYEANVDCNGCHRFRTEHTPQYQQVAVYEATEESCDDCHEDEYKGILPTSQQEFDDLLAKLKKNLAAVTSRTAQMDQVPERLQELVDQAEHNIGMVDIGRGSHNIYYAGQALRYTNAALNFIGGRLKLEMEDTSANQIVSNEFCGGLCHEKVGVDVPKKTVTLWGREIRHLAHVEEALAGGRKWDCTQCHKFGEHKQVETQTKQCLSCHADWKNAEE